MNADTVFLDCPAYLDKRGRVRCALPAEVEYVYTMTSTDGPLESAKIRCPRGHFFNGPIEALRTESQPGIEAPGANALNFRSPPSPAPPGACS
jgi:hypothetical protein